MDQCVLQPFLSVSGNPYMVVKFASDITAQKLKAAENAGKINAIGKSQAVIEFELDGTILHANDNFLATLGYSLEEIKESITKYFVKATMLIQPNIRTSGLNSDRVILNQENLKELQKMVVIFGLTHV